MGVTIALIQPIHGQGYNSDIPRPDAPVIYIGAFPILTARPGLRSIYNKGINPKGNMTARPKFEFAYFEATVQSLCHGTDVILYIVEIC